MSTTTHATASKAGPCSSWLSTLYSVLLSAPPSIISSSVSGNTSDISIHDHHNPRRNYHPPGMIWKRTLGQCVYSDLLQEEQYGSLMSRQRRRFARLESLGLSGVVFYEIPTKEAGFTLKTIFGDPSDKSVRGMTVDGLLEGVGARVVYFPSYACTSFVSGQAMSAFFQQQPRLRPVSVSYGFSVDARAFINSSFTVQRSFALDLLDSCPSPSLSTTLSNSRPLTRSIYVPQPQKSISPMVKTQKVNSRKSLPIEDCTKDCLLSYPYPKAKPRQNKAGDAIRPLGNGSLLAIRRSSLVPKCDTSSKLDTALHFPNTCLSNKKDTKVAQRRRRDMVALSLSSIPDSSFTAKFNDLASHGRIYSTNATPTLPLLNPTSVLRDMHQTPARTEVPVRTSSKNKSTKGKENIAPMTLQLQRQ